VGSRLRDRRLNGLRGSNRWRSRGRDCGLARGYRGLHVDINRSQRTSLCPPGCSRCSSSSRMDSHGAEVEVDVREDVRAVGRVEVGARDLGCVVVNVAPLGLADLMKDRLDHAHL
jgi:hypothetical protein